ncbi:hypothetical protein PV08_00235 [Exophiala spinifera]|uniref:DUF218 domain-containing protein n=1 Tax=Exophiala spinifera TaxID=91928 RepID=A0A0D1YWI2_9EURO|nr:uncharacterized protein PV08_00235 [Exophiala spinifera]KIW19661.1 hypothetical protein PV08_00235 [Exophiala spinifera]
MDLPYSESTVADINTIAEFISCEDISSLLTCPPVDVLVLCGNSILPIAHHVFSALETRPELARTVVICGGIGHSTKFLYEAVRTSPRYHPLSSAVQGMPEARVLQLVMERFYPRISDHVRSGALVIIVEDASTNCGANAVETRRVLEAHGVSEPATFIIVQDPTMSLRTVASFKRAYAEVSPAPSFSACPTFVPRTALDGTTTQRPHFQVPGIQESELWNWPRFTDLVMGEIPRLRDDEHGYGPRGRHFIAHVDIPDAVEAAWKRLDETLGHLAMRKVAPSQ